MEKKLKILSLTLLLFSFILIFFVFISQIYFYDFKKDSEDIKKTLELPIKVFAIENSNVFGGFLPDETDRANFFLSNVTFDYSKKNIFTIASYTSSNNFSYIIILIYTSNCNQSKSFFEHFKSFFSEDELSKKINKNLIKPPIITSNIPTDTSDEFYNYHPYDYFSIKYYENSSNKFFARKFFMYKYKHSIFILSTFEKDFYAEYNLTPSFKILVAVENYLKSNQNFYKKYFYDNC